MESYSRGLFRWRSKPSFLKPIASFVTITACLILAGCQNMVEESGVYYNAGLAGSYNSLMLTNVVRSAKGYPLYFSALGDYSGSTTRQSSPSLQAELPVGAIDESSLSIGLSPLANRGRMSSVSSLEVQDFAQAMHTQVSPALFAFVVDSRAEAHLHLVLALLIEKILISTSDYNLVISGARSTCASSYASLKGSERGICSSLDTVAAEVASCSTKMRNGVITLSNEVSNPCEYMLFRQFGEAFMLNNPQLTEDSSGKSVVSVTSGSTTVNVFTKSGTGLVLRSPNEMIHYLGSIVRETYRTGWTAALTSSDGNNVPIFVVHEGAAGDSASITTEIDGETYWIARQKLGGATTDYSHTALSIAKDFQTLNTTKDQLPSNPSVVVGTGGGG